MKDPNKPDPQMQAAMEEIKPILKKYDCAAIVLLVSEAHMEYLYELEPKWSCVRLEGKDAEGMKLRIRSNSELYPDKAQKAHVVAVTVGMFIGFIDMLAKTTRSMEHVLTKIGEVFPSIQHFTKEIHEIPPDA